MKSFISGFESIFGVSAEEIELGIAEDQVDVMPLEQEPEVEMTKTKDTPRKSKRYSRKVRSVAASETRSTSKNFTSDLESLFRDALTDTFEEDLFSEVKRETLSTSSEKNTNPERKASPEEKPARPRRRISTPGGSGLDLLIRQTSDETILEYESDTKRVSFVFDKEKLKKLKRIAKERQLFLKDVVGEVVGKFIHEYESSNGEVTVD